SRIHKIGIIKPKQQLYMPKKTKIPDPLQNAFENSLIFDKNILEPYKNMFVELSWIYRNLLYFRTASQQTKILHPMFSNVLSPIFVFQSEKWDIYETNMGLYYLTPHKNIVSSKSPIALEKFKKIHPK